jgi:hypothetical protein
MFLRNVCKLSHYTASYTGYVLLQWTETESLGSQATSEPIVPVPTTDESINGGRVTGGKKSKYSEKNLAQCHSEGKQHFRKLSILPELSMMFMALSHARDSGSIP